MTARFLTLPPASCLPAGHLPPARATSCAPAVFHPASPHCASAAFHMVERDGRKRRCPLCPPPCPDCKGRGWRITTDDGTRPECITCEGLGAIVGGRAHG